MGKQVIQTKAATPSAPALENGLVILETLLASNQAVGFSELAKQLTVSKVTASRLLKILGAREWVVKDPSSGRYRAGRKLAGSFSGGDTLGSLRRCSEPILASLAAQTGNTALAIYWNGSQMMWLAKHMSEDAPSMQKVGVVHQDLDLYPWGWLIWEFSSEVERKALRPSMSNLSSFLRNQKRRMRYFSEFNAAFDDGEIRPGYRRLAVPVFDGSGRIIGALGMGSTRQIMPDNVLPSCMTALADAGLSLSRLMGSNQAEGLTR